MPILLIIQVLLEPDGGWRVGAGLAGSRPSWGRLDPDQVRDLLEQVEASLRADDMSPLLLAGDDAAVAAGEERAGRLLAAVLASSPGVARAVSEQRGAARATGRPLVIVLDAHDETIRALPWECLAIDVDEGPLESGGGGLVVRLGAGLGPPPSGALQPVLWTTDAEDPVVRELAADVEMACRSAGLPAPVRPGPDAAERRGPGLVFLVGHGESVDQHLRLLGQDGALAPGTVAHALQPWLAGAALVVLLVCEGGLRSMRARSGLVDSILAAGAPAVLASDARLAAQAGTMLVRELVPALARGDSLALAVTAGRRAVRGLAWPFPDSRWWRLGLTIGHAEAVGWAGPRHRLPHGWSPGPEAGRLLTAAMEHAARRRQRWLGVEHLVLALRDGPSPVRRELRLAARHWSAMLADYLDQFELVGNVPMRLSPRLVRVRDALPAGFQVDDLVEAVLQALPPALLRRLGLPLGRDDGSTYRFDFDPSDTSLPSVPLGDDLLATEDERDRTDDGTGEPGGEGDPCCGLEVLGGPEDGRRIVPAPGEELGRSTSSAQADHALYLDAGGIDPFLSRRHLRFLGPSRVELLRPGYRLVSQPGLRPRGEIELRVGEILGLTPLTWLVALGPSEP